VFNGGQRLRLPQFRDDGFGTFNFILGGWTNSTVVAPSFRTRDIVAEEKVE
jgi:hypothetical protein